MSSFKSSENIQKKVGGPDRSVSDNQSSSVTLNELAMKARKEVKDILYALKLGKAKGQDNINNRILEEADLPSDNPLCDLFF